MEWLRNEGNWEKLKRLGGPMSAPSTLKKQNLDSNLGILFCSDHKVS